MDEENHFIIKIVHINSGSVAKNPKNGTKFWFHIKECKKAEYFSDSMQI